MEAEKSLFKKGELVIISIDKGFKGHELKFLTTKEKLYMDDNEYLVGQIMSSHENIGKFGRNNFLVVVLTVQGIISISKFSFLGYEDNGCVQVNSLTPAIGDWLTENCDHNTVNGKWKLRKGLLAVTSFTEFIGQLPQEEKR